MKTSCIFKNIYLNRFYEDKPLQEALNISDILGATVKQNLGKKSKTFGDFPREGYADPPYPPG